MGRRTEAQALSETGRVGKESGLGVPLTGVAQDSAFHESWLIFFPLLPPPLSLFRQAQSSAQLMDLFQVRWTQGQCTMGTHGS